MPKWDYLLESDERRRQAIRQASEANDPMAYHRAIARLYGPDFSTTNEIADRWPELRAMNDRAAKLQTEPYESQAHRLVREALSKGFAIIVYIPDERTLSPVNIIIGPRQIMHTILPDGAGPSHWRIVNRGPNLSVYDYIRMLYSYLDRNWIDPPVFAVIPRSAIPRETPEETE